jgi:hypothetical protein
VKWAEPRARERNGPNAEKAGPGKRERARAEGRIGSGLGRSGVRKWAARVWGCWAGVFPLGWFGFLGLGFISFSISTPLSLFLIQTKFEFKYKFEFKPHSNK